jgi:SAM-dependent methyltransferase
MGAPADRRTGRWTGTGSVVGVSGTISMARVRDAVGRRARRLERVVHRDLLSVGDRVLCPLCGWQGLRFSPSYNPRRTNRICPRCSSSERYRALDLWLRDRPVRPGARLLEVAPIDLVAPLARRLGYTYASVDLYSPRAEVRGDLCHLPFRDGTFDVIVCFHVLEHVPDDHAAMQELARVTRGDGESVVVVPWDPSRTDTYEDPTITSPEDRERAFGQSDHVRIYGPDVTDRLLAAGFAVQEAPWATLFGPAPGRRAALEGNDDRFWLCRPADRAGR